VTDQTYTAKWYDLYHHLVATGEAMGVRGGWDGMVLDWVATPAGLNRYGEQGESTATWYPERGDVLQTPEPIPVRPRVDPAVRKAADLLRLAAAGRLEYLASCPEGSARDVLEAEASTLRHAADVVEGDLRPLYGWLPSWRWTDDMDAQLRRAS
jgi:hypothetical protein